MSDKGVYVCSLLNMDYKDLLSRKIKYYQVLKVSILSGNKTIAKSILIF